MKKWSVIGAPVLAFFFGSSVLADVQPATGIGNIEPPVFSKHFARSRTTESLDSSVSAAFPNEDYAVFDQDHAAPVAPPARRLACDASAFVTSGGTLLNQIRTQGFDCVGELFSDASDTIRRGTFTQANIVTVANEAKRVAEAYDGTDPDDYLVSMYYWIRAFYYYDNRGLLTAANQNATAAALTALFNNDHFLDVTKVNAGVVDIAVSNMNNALVGDRFVWALKKVLASYGESHEAIRDWSSALAAIVWQTLNQCANKAECRVAEHNAQLVALVGNYIHTNISWLDKPDNDHHLHNLGYQLGNLYRSAGASHFAAMEPELKLQLGKIFNTFGPLKKDRGRRAYLQAMNAVDYRDQCATYDLCNKKEELITQVLDDRISCDSGTLFMWAQDMNQAQLEWACNSLKSHEDYFHQTMQTNRVPVTPDDNERLRMIVFNDSREWRTYGGILFGASTDNGGLYLEGDPSKAGDQATFFAYEHVSERPIFDIWNLRHEYIHYLDGRFVKQGDFRLNNGTGRTVWYGEGVAEYISLRNCNARAADLAKQGTHSISTIFQNEYGVGSNRIYPWGYLSVRYMFEQQNSTFFQMLDKFRNGEYASYRTDMVDPWVSNKTFDPGFTSWLPDVTSSGCVIDDTRPPSPPEPIDIDDVQGTDKPGIDACAAGNAGLDGGRLKAGVAACLTGTDNRNQVQMSLSVPSGVVADMEVTLRHGTGNGNLYHRWDSRPTPSNNDYASETSGNTETILVKSVKSGWNYIHVVADPSFANTTVLARFVKKNDGGNSNDAPTAEANGPYAAQIGGSITFSSSGSSDSDGSIASYAWKFGDGNTSSTANPSHSYADAGSYTATLTVTDDKGATATDVATVTVSTSPPTNAAPSAEANGPYTARTGSAIVFSSNGSTDSDGSIASYEWNFGDGNNSAVANPSHTYSSGAGLYTATLTVTDDKGATNSDSATVTVTAAPPGNVAPKAEANGPYSAMSGSAIAFSSAGSVDSDGSITAYSWNFGDGNSSTAANPSHSYASTGNYTVTLMVTDDKGATGSDTATAVVNAPPPANMAPLAEANGPYSATVGNSISFNSTGSTDVDGSIVAYRWNFGDGNSGATANPSHTYTAAGTFTVTLTVTDDKGATATDTAEVTVSAVNSDSGGNNPTTPNSGGNTNANDSGTSAASPWLMLWMTLVVGFLRLGRRATRRD